MHVCAGLVTTVIYKKSLLFSSNERGNRASGDIVNLMSVDASRLQDLCTYCLIAISGPFQVTERICIHVDAHATVRLHWLSCLYMTFLDGLLLSELQS
jgi:hypothetical protein